MFNKYYNNIMCNLYYYTLFSCNAALTLLQCYYIICNCNMYHLNIIVFHKPVRFSLCIYLRKQDVAY